MTKGMMGEMLFLTVGDFFKKMRPLSETKGCTYPGISTLYRCNIL